jgi:hypothetical protein
MTESQKRSSRSSMWTLIAGSLLCTTCLVAQVITTVAGTDNVFPTNSLTATGAPIGLVTGVALDTAGNFYLTDVPDNLVMRVTPDGTLTVVAGNGRAGFSGDGVWASWPPRTCNRQ